MLTVIVVLEADVVAPTGLPVTLTFTGPVGVPDATPRVKSLVAPAAVGLTEVGLKELQVTPEGSGVTQDKVTD